MIKIFAYISLVLALFTAFPAVAKAQEIADGSASFKSLSGEAGYDYRVENLRNFLLRFNSPLAAYAADFVKNADLNGLDYRLVPSISGVESTFGKQIPSQKSYNAYGWAGGKYDFQSWPDSIGVVSSTLKSEYIEKGAATIAKIARRYAPPSQTWGGNVKFFISKIDKLPLNFDLSG